MGKNKVKTEKRMHHSLGKVKSAGQVHAELEMVKGMLARALADYDNLSKRVDRERTDLGKIASVGIIVRLLPVLDNLESAQTHLQDPGLAISVSEFKKVLAESGLDEIRPVVGEKFDEQTMEAIEVVAGEGNNNISEVVLPGWKFEDGTIVRHAKVKVSKK
jgi:molecular chaperone GrpE